jgi:hypothetical protein
MFQNFFGIIQNGGDCDDDDGDDDDDGGDGDDDGGGGDHGDDGDDDGGGDDDAAYLFCRYPIVVSSCSRLQTVQLFLFQPKDEDAFSVGWC